MERDALKEVYMIFVDCYNINHVFWAKLFFFFGGGGGLGGHRMIIHNLYLQKET